MLEGKHGSSASTPNHQYESFKSEVSRSSSALHPESSADEELQLDLGEPGTAGPSVFIVMHVPENGYRGETSSYREKGRALGPGGLSIPVP